MGNIKTDILVIGGGPGGYAAAFYAAVSGKKVILVEKDDRLGGVCLNRGCIPSKALLHVAESIMTARVADKFGIRFSEPQIDLEKLRLWKDSVITKLGQGIRNLAGRRNVEILQGQAVFQDKETIQTGGKLINFNHAILATGSVPVVPKILATESPLVMTSTEALEFSDIPKRLLVIGAGYIGMELGTVYAAFGSEVTVVEALPAMLNGADPDLVRYVEDLARKCFKKIYLRSKVLSLSAAKEHVTVVIEREEGRLEEQFDRVLVSVGRVPFTEGLGLEKAGIKTDEKGFIRTDAAKRTSVPNIFAIGDVTGGVMLAHKASHDARVAVETICGHNKGCVASVIPAVVFTDPEIAWCGVTETEVRAKNIPVQVVKFPWAASGRAATMERTDGATKILIDPVTEKILGVGICGKGAGELIAEAVLAIEKGMTVRELAAVIHPHPTLSETLMECAEMFYGRATHAFSRKRG